MWVLVTWKQRLFLQDAALNVFAKKKKLHLSLSWKINTSVTVLEGTDVSLGSYTHAASTSSITFLCIYITCVMYLCKIACARHTKTERKRKALATLMQTGLSNLNFNLRKEGGRRIEKAKAWLRDTQIRTRRKIMRNECFPHCSASELNIAVLDECQQRDGAGPWLLRSDTLFH